MNKRDIFIKYLFYLMLLVFICFSIKLYFEPPYQSLYEEYENESYSGVVIKKIVDKRNHGYREITLNNGHQIRLPNTAYDVFDNIVLGDSLSKEKSNLKCFVFRNDSLFTSFNYPEITNKIHN